MKFICNKYNSIKVAKSCILTAHTLTRVIVPVEQSSVKAIIGLSVARQKRDRLLGSKYIIL